MKMDPKEIANLIRLANVARGHLESANILLEEIAEKGAELLHWKDKGENGK